jgi:hypothetical protein
VVGTEIDRRRPQRLTRGLALAPQGIQPPIRLGNVTLEPEETKSIELIRTGFERIVSRNGLFESFLSLHNLVIASHGFTPRWAVESLSSERRSNSLIAAGRDGMVSCLRRQPSIAEKRF